VTLFAEVVDAVTLATRVAALAEEIAADYAGRQPVLLGVLNGAVPFLADLSRRLPTDIEIDFLSLTRFGEEGRVGISMDTATPISGRDVIVVEDVVDTGLTLSFLLGLLETRDPASLTTVTLLDKVTRRMVGDEFLLGYGLDWDGRYRNLPSLWAVLDLGKFQENPDLLAREAFPEAGDRLTG